MDKICAFSKNHQCLKWHNYLVTLQELEEADELCHLNWIEIEKLRSRVAILERIILDSNLELPE